MSMPQDKDRLRDQIRARRSALSENEQQVLSTRICENLQQILPMQPDACIAGYWPVRGEADVRPYLQAVRAQGAKVALPRIVSRSAPMEFCRWDEQTIFQNNRMGIPEPGESAEVIQPTVLLIPVVGFDRQGNRLGQGGGFYDRTLEHASQRGAGLKRIGIAYDFQEVEKVPYQPHDQKLDVIVTNLGWILINKKDSTV